MSPLPPMTTTFISHLQLSLHRDEYRRVLVLQQDHHELGWLRVARVASDRVDVLRPLVERLTVGERNGLATLHTHYDGAFEHVDERVSVVLVDRVGAARWILH